MPCLIAAPSSGSGKTLLSLCLAALARQRALRLQPFKVGPDYLDPQLLSRVSGLSCRNLDPLLCGEAWLERCFHWHGSRADLVLVEGVMGLFDGLGSSSRGSSAAVAAQLGLPVVLVVEASRQSSSLAALVRGFRDHGREQAPQPLQLAGVVLNRVNSTRHRQLLSEALASIAVPLLGVLPSEPVLELPSRHLGLHPPHELADLELRQARWAALAEQHLDLDRLWPLLAPPAPAPASAAPGARRDPISWCLQQAGGGDLPGPRVKSWAHPLPLAVASDAAFHFRYPETDELLRALGLEPLPWSPLADQPLPPGCRGVLLPGGYPELHASQLASSRRSLAELGDAARRGLPIVAECGGLLLLGRSLHDPLGVPHAMAGVLPFGARRGELSLGYRQATAAADGLLLRRGESVWAHEFHRWQLQPDLGSSEHLWQVDGWGVPSGFEGWTAPNVHASWLHLHWAGCPAIPTRLAAACGRVVPRPASAAS
ncbi:MAG: cobyrinate a,c-diamide synthase [Cyanobacteriota bacterium]|nr:cobyrinate a,c-diamide synthase [Cyanobacteriota bacterium]